MRKSSTAIVLGATGLVGHELTMQLLADLNYGRVVSLGRRVPEIEGAKLEAYVIDFEARETWCPLVRGDVLFLCLGTTLKVAGSKKAQYRVDHDYQLWAAEAAKENGVHSIVVVSSKGADCRSRSFYLSMKGQLEEGVRLLELPLTAFLRPSFLAGERVKKRTGEEIALRLMKVLPAWKALDGARPIPAGVVARAMRKAVGRNSKQLLIWESAEIFQQGTRQLVR